MAKKPKRSEPFYSPPKQRPDWLVEIVWGGFIGVWLSVLAALLNPDLEWHWAVGTGLICALMGAFRVSRLGLHILSGLLTFGVAICIFTPVLQPFEDYLDVTELPTQADVIINLGGGYWCGTSQLEAASLARIAKGLELWRSGYASTITITDAHGLAPNCGSIEDAAFALIQKLYPNNLPNIVVLKNMKTTRTEAEAVAKEARIRGWKKILVVTSPSHSRRAKATFAQLGLDAFVVAATEPRFDSSLRTPFDRLMAIRVITRELAGFAKYSLLGWF